MKQFKTTTTTTTLTATVTIRTEQDAKSVNEVDMHKTENNSWN